MDVDAWVSLTENVTSPSLSPGLVNSSSAVRVWGDAEQPGEDKEEEGAYRDFAISAQLLILAGSLLGEEKKP